MHIHGQFVIRFRTSYASIVFIIKCPTKVESEKLLKINCVKRSGLSHMLLLLLLLVVDP